MMRLCDFCNDEERFIQAIYFFKYKDKIIACCYYCAKSKKYYEEIKEYEIK